jgi:hypothetical protein
MEARKMKTKIIFTMLGVLLYAGGLAKANPITIAISGQVTDVGDQYGLLQNQIHVGDTFSGTYTYDSAAIDTNIDSKVGEYTFSPPHGISLSLDGLTFQTDLTQTPGRYEILIGNDWILDAPPYGMVDVYAVGSAANSPTAGLEIGGISWNLRDNTNTALSSVDLPVTAPIPSAWNYNILNIYGGNGQYGFAINGIVTQATPEPLTSLLMMTGAIFLWRRR